MKPTPSTPTERVTRSRRSTPLHEGLPAHDSPHHRNLRGRLIKKEMDTEKTPEKEQTQDSMESAPRTPARSTRRSLTLPPSAEKNPVGRRTRSLSIQHTIAEDAEMESTAAEDQNSEQSDQKSVDVQDRTAKQKKSSVKDVDGGIDSTSHTKCHSDASSENEESVDTKLPVLRSSRRLLGNKESSSEDQPFTRITRRTRHSSSVSSEVSEIKSLEKIIEIETEVAAEQKPTKSKEMESVELASAQNVETKENSSEGFFEEAKKSPIFKKSSVLGTVQETEENSDIQARIAERKSPRIKKKSLDISETVSEPNAEMDSETKRIAEKKSPKIKKSLDTSEKLPELRTVTNDTEEKVLDNLEAVPDSNETCDVRARIAEKKSPKTKKSPDTSEVVSETKAETIEEETVLESNENCDVRARIAEKKSPKSKEKSSATIEAISEAEAETNTGTVLDVLEVNSESKENFDVHARIAEKKSPKNKKSPETLEETKAETNKENTVSDVLEVVPETKQTLADKKKSPQKRKKSETVPAADAETQNEAVLDKTTELEISNSSSVVHLQKETESQSAEKLESVIPDLCKFPDIGEDEIKDFISVCRHEIEKQSDVVLLPKTVDVSASDGKAVNDENTDGVILLLDESNDSIDIPKKVKTKSPHKDKIIDLTVVSNTFGEHSVFDTPQSSPEEAVSSKTPQKNDMVSETPKTVKEDIGSAKTLKSANEIRGDSDFDLEHKTPKKVEESSEVKDTVSSLETPKTRFQESDKCPTSLKEVVESSDGGGSKHKKSKTSKKAVEENFGIEKELTKTPKSGQDIGEILKMETNPPKSTDDGSDVGEIKHKKSKSEKKNIESSEVEYSVSKLDIPETVVKESKKTPKSAKIEVKNSEKEEAKEKTPDRKVEESSMIKSTVSKLETPKIVGKNSAIPLTTLKEGESAEEVEVKLKKRKTPKKVEESSAVETEQMKTPKLVIDVEETSKTETPKSTTENSKSSDINEVKSKKRSKSAKKNVENSEFDETKTPKEYVEETSKTETPKSTTENSKSSDINEVKSKKKSKSAKKNVENSEVDETKTPKEYVGETPKLAKYSDKPSTTLKEVEPSDGGDIKLKKTKTPKKKVEEHSVTETEQTKTPAFIIDVGENLKGKTPKSTEENSNGDEVKSKKKSKSSKKNVESSEVDLTKTPKKYIGENSEVPDKVPTSEECSIVETKPVKTPKSGKNGTEQSSEVQTIKPPKKLKSAKKNVEKINAEILKSVKDETELSSTVKSKRSTKTMTDAEKITDDTPENDEGENSEPKSKKRKKKSKKNSDENSEVAEIELVKTPKLAKEEMEEKSKIEEIKPGKTTKSAKKYLRESSENEQPVLVGSFECVDEAEEESEISKKKRKKSAKKSREDFETDETATSKMMKLKRKFAESFKTDPKSEESTKSSVDESQESSDVRDSKYKKASKDSLESREVKIKSSKTSKSAKKKVCESSELMEDSDLCTEEKSDAVVVVNMNPKEKKILEKVKDSSVISKIKSSKEIVNTNLNIPSDTDSAIKFVPISKIQLSEETVTNEVLDVPHKKIKSAEKENLKKLNLQDASDVQLKKLIKKLKKKSLKDFEVCDESDVKLKKLKKLKEKYQTPCEINEAKLEPQPVPKKLKKKTLTKCDIDDETDLQLKKLLKKLEKKKLMKGESNDNDPENVKLVKLMKQMKKLKKKSLKINKHEDETELEPEQVPKKLKKKSSTECEIVDAAELEPEQVPKKLKKKSSIKCEINGAAKKRKAEKPSDVDEKKMKLDDVKVKSPGVILTSSIPKTFDRIDVQNLFLEKNIKLLSMRSIQNKTELCIEDAEQMCDAITLLTSNFCGSSVRIDEYPLSEETNATTDDDGFLICQLYVDQIPSHATKSDLLALFPKATKCELPRKSLDKNKGFCFLTFPDEATALEHLTLHNKVNFAGRKLGIYTSKKDFPLGVYGDMLKEMFLDVADLDELLIIKDLPSGLNQLNLADLFPSVLDLKVIPYFEKKNRPGAAIIVCKNAEQAQMFLEKNVEWKGKKLNVQKTTDQIFNNVMKQFTVDEDELSIYAGRLLKVMNLPKGSTAQEIQELFSSAIFIKVIEKKEFAVVAFSTNEEAEEICKRPADQLTIHHKRVEVMHYEFGARNSKKNKSLKQKNCKVRMLHVTGFSPTTTVIHLRGIFKDSSVVIPKIKGRPYAIVKCRTVTKANTYLAKKNLVVRGKILKIRPAYDIIRQMKRELQLEDK